MSLTPQAILDALQQHRLVADDKLATARQWFTTNPLPPGADVAAHAGRFGPWLLDQGILTPFQMDFIERGKADKLRLGEYVLIDRIGVGRMAGVYKARKGGQTVAVKVLPPSKAKDPETFARFQREGRLAARLKHPNVVRTFDMGEADGLHYIAMEYLDGDTLDDVLKQRGALTAAEVTRFLRQALEALQHLHEQDVVHRDLKPANLMLTSAPRSLTPDSPTKKEEAGKSTLDTTVKLLDVGLGRTLFDDAPEGQIELTEAGDLLGTVAYMAPEQAKDAHQADVRSDLYSLGCVAYHALTGQPPFVDKNNTRVLVMHATQTPKPVRQFNPAISATLAGVVDKLLAKDPAQRFATPKAAVLALDAAPQAKGSSSGAPAPPVQVGPRPSWLPYAGAGGAVVVALIVGVVVFLNSGNSGAPDKSGKDIVAGPGGDDKKKTAEPSQDPVAALVNQLKEADPLRRIEAAQGLAKLGGDAQPAFADLVEALRDADAAVREQASTALSKLKPAPADLPAIRAALREPGETSKIFAAGALVQLGIDAKEDLSYLRLLALDESDEVRDAGDKAIQQLEPVLVGALIRELSDPAPDVRRAAALSLGQMKVDAGKALPNLIEAVSDKNSAVRVAAMDALVLLGPEAVPVLVETLKEKNVPLRRTAIICLGRMGPDAKETVPALYAQAQDKKLVKEVRDALEQIGPYAVPDLVKAYETERTAAGQKLITEVLVKIGPEALPTLKNLGKDNKSAQAVAEQVAKNAVPAKEKPRKPLTGKAAIYETNLRGWFTTADLDKDGQLDKKEIATAIRKSTPFQSGLDANPAAKVAAKDFAKNPESAFIARLDRDADGAVSRDEYDLWARDYAEYQVEMGQTQQKIADAERRLLEKNLNQAMRLQYEANVRNLWASYYVARRNSAHMNHMEWMQRQMISAAKKRK